MCSLKCIHRHRVVDVCSKLQWVHCALASISHARTHDAAHRICTILCCTVWWWRWRCTSVKADSFVRAANIQDQPKSTTIISISHCASRIVIWWEIDSSCNWQFEIENARIAECIAFLLQTVCTLIATDKDAKIKLNILNSSTENARCHSSSSSSSASCCALFLLDLMLLPFYGIKWIEFKPVGS